MYCFSVPLAERWWAESQRALVHGTKEIFTVKGMGVFVFRDSAQLNLSQIAKELGVREKRLIIRAMNLDEVATQIKGLQGYKKGALWLDNKGGMIVKFQCPVLSDQLCKEMMIRRGLETGEDVRCCAAGGTQTAPSDCPVLNYQYSVKDDPPVKKIKLYGRSFLLKNFIKEIAVPA